MLFNSNIFIFCFVPLTLVGFFGIARFNRGMASAWLVAASFVFYGWWDTRYLWLLTGSIAFNYGVGYALGGGLRLPGWMSMRALLILGIAANLAVLAYYKYAGFFVNNLEQLAGIELQFANVVLPLGISFFTFTQIAFLVDTYQGKVKEYSAVHYALFVTYFPHLIAGPVLHHKEMMPQFMNPAAFAIDGRNVAAGLAIFTLGLAKKVLIADSMAQYATPVFDGVAAFGQPRLIEAWAGALAYSLQLYFDFSGYCDMAIGLSLLFNVRLPINFDSPYKSLSIIEFWRRWHMTLSRFLRDYLYIPLGGSRRGAGQRYLNLMITMVLGGLWHGAAWTFVVWGTLHGLYLMVNHGWRGLKARLGWGDGGRAARFAAVGLTFVCVVVGWVFFRSESLDGAWQMLRGMAGLNGLSVPERLQAGALGSALTRWGVEFGGAFTLADLNLGEFLPLLTLGLLLVFCCPNSCELLRRFQIALHSEPGESAGPRTGTRTGWGERALAVIEWRPTRLQGVVYGVLFFLTVKHMSSAGKSEFLYFQF